MAVQAQYPSNAFRPQNGVFDDQSPNLLRAFSSYALPPQMVNGTVFSDPESELTCNISGSRKRNREETMPLHQQQILQQQYQYATSLPKIAEKTSHDVNRLIESTAASTSGRTASFSQDLVSCLHQQSVELDALIRLQNEKLRLGLEEARKRHMRSLSLTLEQRVLKRLREKETELDSVKRRNAELEEKVKQMSAENQIWCHVARNNEAIVSNLRTSLEQILLQNSGTVKEGYGDSCDGTPGVGDDAQSCCYEAVEERTNTEKTVRENREMKLRRTCKSCREKDVSVLLLPCRHLCLCKECESRLDSCPICNSMKNASIQIFMS